MPDIKSLIYSHNQNVLNTSSLVNNNRNYRGKKECPFKGKCLLKGVYKATMHCKGSTRECIDSKGLSFKTRFNHHKFTFKSSKSLYFDLSKYVNSKQKTSKQRLFAQ